MLIPRTQSGWDVVCVARTCCTLHHPRNACYFREMDAKTNVSDQFVAIYGWPGQESSASCACNDNSSHFLPHFYQLINMIRFSCLQVRRNTMQQAIRELATHPHHITQETKYIHLEIKKSTVIVKLFSSQVKTCFHFCSMVLDGMLALTTYW